MERFVDEAIENVFISLFYQLNTIQTFVKISTTSKNQIMSHFYFVVMYVHKLIPSLDLVHYYGLYLDKSLIWETHILA